MTKPRFYLSQHGNYSFTLESLHLHNKCSCEVKGVVCTLFPRAAEVGTVDLLVGVGKKSERLETVTQQ